MIKKLLDFALVIYFKIKKDTEYFKFLNRI